MQKIPHPDRLVFPEAGIRRRDLLVYYVEVGPFLVQWAQGRPVTLRRYPHGLASEHFYQKRDKDGAPIFLHNLNDLLWWVGQGAVEFHAPLGYAAAPDVHDWAVLDLDPHPPAGWPEVVDVAHAVMRLLALLHVPYLMKTSGKAGLHFYLAIEPCVNRTVVAVMRVVAEIVAGALPDVATVAWRKRDRGPRVYLDYLQNAGQRTTVMPFSVRATPQATVSTPIGAHQLSVTPSAWTIKTVPDALRTGACRFEWSGPRVDLPRVAAHRGLWKGRPADGH
ncbi:MAG: DNA primase [Firmicutes bacterium]|nr:DNA primase [Bacillota bacterium]